MKRGFSLVELSVVLVIIGLLVGGVLLGQSLIRASRVNSLMSDIAQTRQAVKMFREKYRALPGDMPNATTVWGEAAASCTVTASTTAATCNGNGDGRIGAQTSIALPATAYEVLRAWQHLGNAGMMKGTFTGGPTVVGQALSGEPGTNLPSLALSEASMLLVTQAISGTADANYFQNMRDMIMLGAVTRNATGTAGWTDYPLLTPEEALSIDTKIDDAKPGYGRVITLKDGSAHTPNCVTTAVADTAAYEIANYNNQKVCSLLIDVAETTD